MTKYRWTTIPYYDGWYLTDERGRRVLPCPTCGADKAWKEDQQRTLRCTQCGCDVDGEAGEKASKAP